VAAKLAAIRQAQEAELACQAEQAQLSEEGSDAESDAPRTEDRKAEPTDESLQESVPYR
jgi:hypothetical protein